MVRILLCWTSYFIFKCVLMISYLVDGGPWKSQGGGQYNNGGGNRSNDNFGISIMPE
jgi:hypothetical protein